MSDNAVDIRDLKVTFATDGGDVRAVDGVTLSVAKGEILAIVGESGSGKTVTAKAMLGLLPSTAIASGQLIIDGEDVIAADKRRLRQIRGQKAAMVFQEPSTALNPVFTVGWQIVEGIRAHGKVSRKEARKRAIAMLEAVGIPDAANRIDYYPHQFSGGQKQRIVIAMALVLNPAVIIADEPTTALDVTVQAEILELLRRIRDEFGTAIVLITHNMGVVADLADRVAVMHHGVVVEAADVRELFAAPKDEYTKTLLAAVPRVQLTGAEPMPETAAPVVTAEQLVIEYPGRFRQPAFKAVNEVDFQIRQGEVLGLVGESGSGKTTIGRAIARLTKATGGRLDVLGVDVVTAPDRQFQPLRRRIGFVFQDPATSFNPLTTIGKAIAEPIFVHGTAAERAGARERVEDLLEAVRLPRGFADRYPHELSGGQRQRASLARALILGPDLVIADEPTSALDTIVQAEIVALLDGLVREDGMTLLFITHDIALASGFADRIAVFRQARLVEAGPTPAVLSLPKEEYTRRLIASHIDLATPPLIGEAA